MIKLFEYLRLILVVTGLWLAFQFPAQAAFYLVCGVVLPLNGLLAVQAFFFPQASADYLQRQSSVYVRYQAAAFWFSVFLVGIGVLVFHAGFQAQFTLVALTLLGFLLSSVVHLAQYIKEDNALRVHLWRFIGSVVLCVAALIAIWGQLTT